MERDASKDVPRQGTSVDYAQRLAAAAGRIGVDPADSGEIPLQKRLTVLLFLGTVPLTIFWAVAYLAVSAPLAASTPLTYSVIAPINTAIFAMARNLAFYRFTQLLVTLILPFLVMVSLGGFSESSVVIIWAALTPLMALLLEGLNGTVFWIAGFVGLLIAGALLQPYLRPAGLPAEVVTLFFAMNLGAVVSIIFASLLFRRSAEFLSGALRGAVAQYPSQRNLGGPQSGAPHDRSPS
jgi:adenylate cyclase